MLGFGTQLLDVAIGLIFIYVVASLIASAIVEVLETFLRTRAKYLWQGVGELLGETLTGSGGGRERAPEPPTTADAIIDPQLEERRELKTGHRQMNQRGANRGRNKKPIPAANDSTSTIRMQSPPNATTTPVAPGPSQPVDISVEALYKHPLIASLFFGSYQKASARVVWRRLPPYIPRETFSTAIIDMVSEGQRADASGQSSIEALKRGVAALPDSSLRTALRSMIRVTGDDVVLLQRRIEAWYDTSMDTVSGWYKRHAQLMLLAVGFLLASAANIDTWRIAKTLANDAPTREALLEAATEFAASQNRSGASLTQQQMADYVNAAGSSALFARDTVDWYSPLGWLATAFAISLGAPFWFDLLNKVMVVRSTVKPKEKSQDEGSEDRTATGSAPLARVTPTVFLR